MEDKYIHGYQQSHQFHSSKIELTSVLQVPKAGFWRLGGYFGEGP